jgi:hypothetical protein
MVVIVCMWLWGNLEGGCVIDLVFDFPSFARPSPSDFIPGFFLFDV